MDRPFYPLHICVSEFDQFLGQGTLTRLELALEELLGPLIGDLDVSPYDDLLRLPRGAEAADLLNHHANVVLVEIACDAPHEDAVNPLLGILVPVLRHEGAEVWNGGVEDGPLPLQRQLGEVRHLDDRAGGLGQHTLLVADYRLQKRDWACILPRKQEELLRRLAGGHLRARSCRTEEDPFCLGIVDVRPARGLSVLGRAYGWRWN